MYEPMSLTLSQGVKTMSSTEASDLIASRTVCGSGGFGFVYALESTCGTRVKVGRSRKPDERLRTLVSQAGGSGRSTVFGPFDDSRAVERTLHEVFASSRGEGEWFAHPYDEVVAFIGLSTAQAISRESTKTRDEYGERTESRADRLVAAFFDRFYPKKPTPDFAAAVVCAAEQDDQALGEWSLFARRDQYHLNRYQQTLQVTPDLIRWQVINDDTVVFRAQDVCDAAGALDYAMALQCVDHENVVIFSHPDTDAKGMRYACVTRAGALQLLNTVHDDLGDWPGRSFKVLNELDRIVDSVRDEVAEVA